MPYLRGLACTRIGYPEYCENDIEGYWVQDIIENIELDPDYYAKCTLVYFVSSQHSEFYNYAKQIVHVPQSAVKVKIEEH